LDIAHNPVVSVIVPARNEEACLAICLDSLVSQTGIDFEVIVVDDASTDGTAEIARAFASPMDMSPGEDARNSTSHVGADALVRPGPAGVSPDRAFSDVTVIPAPPLPAHWTGKNNAIAAGAKIAKGKWLLFTDADTVHKPGSLARAVAEAEQHGAALLSYSPEQEVRTFWEKAVMPVIFAELAATYSPAKVSDPASPIAAANGQYLMILREAYDAVSGHTKIAGDLLEDVAMARLVKSSSRKIFFRYGGDAVRTRMYRSWAQMKEGWTKNLALLFKHPVWRALMLLAFWAFSWIAFNLGLAAIVLGQWRIAYYVVPLVFLYARVAWGRFPLAANLVAIAYGIPMAAYLLVRSAWLHKHGGVIWKGRMYPSEAA
jgi:glycosyltransferase involved in cell wall biosynthesis